MKEYEWLEHLYEVGRITKERYLERLEEIIQRYQLEIDKVNELIKGVRK